MLTANQPDFLGGGRLWKLTDVPILGKLVNTVLLGIAIDDLWAVDKVVVFVTVIRYSDYAQSSLPFV